MSLLSLESGAMFSFSDRCFVAGDKYEYHSIQEEEEAELLKINPEKNYMKPIANFDILHLYLHPI